MEGTDFLRFAARAETADAPDFVFSNFLKIKLTFYHLLLYNKYNAIVVPQRGRLHLYRRNIIWTRTPALMKNRF